MSNITVKVPIPCGPEHLWSEACAFGAAGFSMSDLHGRTNGVARDTVYKWVRTMIARDLIAVRFGGRGAARYHVANATHKPPIAPEMKYGRIERHLWTAMRNLPSFSLDELAAAASTDDVTILRKSAANYVRRLTQVGVLVVVRAARQNQRNSGLWRLKASANTGPLPPRQIKAQFFIDRNTGKSIGCVEVSS